MKKIILLFVLAGSIFACTKKEDRAAASTGANGQNGITIDSSANTDLVRKMIAAYESGDSATYRSTYSTDVIFIPKSGLFSLRKFGTVHKYSAIS